MRTPRLMLGVVNVLVLALAVGTVALRPGATGATDPALDDMPLAAPGDWFDAQRAAGDDARAYARAIAQANGSAARTAATDPDLAALEWQHLGPTNIGGRVVDLAVEGLNTVWLASASGGVWRSENAGVTFARAWPDDLTQSIGAIGVTSDGVVFAGTGEANPGGGSVTYGGTGLYRSTDGGGTWEHVGLATAGSFGRIVVDPSDPDRLFAAATGNLFVPGGDRGLWRSTDGGDSWERVLVGPNDTTGAVDVEIDPSDPDHLLAALWDRRRTPSHRTYAGVGSGVYRSTDGGDTWTSVPEIMLPKPADVGRIGVGFAASDSSRAYAVIASRANGTFGGFWRSDDGAATFTKLADDLFLPGNMSVYGWWFGRIWVDPRNADRLFVGGLELLDSVDGGRRFAPQSNYLLGVGSGVNQIPVHADQQAMAFHPTIPGRVYLGNDGGFYRSDAGGLPGTWVAAASQGWTQHYSVDVGEQTPDYVVSGLQDNMCLRSSLEPGVGTPGSWTKFGLCGDGLQTLVHPTDETTTWGCSQYGGCSRSRYGVLDPTSGAPDSNGRNGWFTPLEYAPGDPSVMYFGSHRVRRTTNGGNSWTTISPDLTLSEPQLDPHSGYKIRHVITTIAPAASDPRVLYVGTDDGQLWRTEDLGQSWDLLTDDEDLPGSWITRVAVDPADADIAYVTYSGFRSGEDAPHVLRTTDGGKQWTDISGDLPDAPVNDIVVIGQALAVATDVGVFLTRDVGDQWHLVGGNLPRVPVTDLRWHEGSGTLTAATFGHGIQRVTLP